MTGINELAREVHERAGTTFKQAQSVLEEAIGEIAAALKAGGEVRLPGIGTIKVKAAPAHIGRHPQTGEPLDIPERRQAKFSSSTALKQALNPPVPLVPRRVP